MTTSDLPTLPFETRDSWETWLAENQETAKGVWLKLAKKGSGIASVTYPEALEAALCYGWIDGQKAPADDLYWLQKFTPAARGASGRGSIGTRPSSSRLKAR